MKNVRLRLAHTGRLRRRSTFSLATLYIRYYAIYAQSCPTRLPGRVSPCSVLFPACRRPCLPGKSNIPSGPGCCLFRRDMSGLALPNTRLEFCYRALGRLPGQDVHLQQQHVLQDAPRTHSSSTPRARASAEPDAVPGCPVPVADKTGAELSLLRNFHRFFGRLLFLVEARQVAFRAR
jgi:hypothetical protein